MSLPAHLDSKFPEANLLIMYNEKLAREQKETLWRLIQLPELSFPEHQKYHTLLVAQHRAVEAFIMAMEESWEKEKIKKKNI